ncbi:hypothetical protein BT93_D1435 [Corymbia citriodora subsp. variegata]|nr:hypothetical protein BT93_D1435 [Corymbia citriodora subsp. variegata]
MLLTFGYQVLTAESVGNALSIIRERRANLDLILTEIHLPDADKFEVLEKLGRASNLPFIIMTADNNESTMLGALLRGASLYLLKPISKLDIRDLWQFSFMWKRDQMTQVTEGNTDQDSSEEEEGDDEPESQLPAIAVKQGEVRPRKHECAEVDGYKEEYDANLRLHKKTKLIWTHELHEKFVRAVRLVGIDRAQPKKILQLMNVPGIRKQSVASHLQKYRLSLKRHQDTILKTGHPESYRLSSATHQQELLSFSESSLQATATTKDSHPLSCFRPNPDISLVMARDRDREPWN